MSPISIQTILISSSLFLVGLAIGWWVRMLYHSATKQTFLQELNQLRERHKLNRQEHEKTQQELAKLKEMYEFSLQQKKQLTSALTQELYHEDYLKLRKQLEQTRKQLDQSQAEVKRRERHILRLVDLARTLKKQLPHVQNAGSTESLTQAQALPLFFSNQPDDLQQIDGITHEIARKLQQLGIHQFRQLAECTPSQLQQITELLGKEQELPVKEWVLLAKQLVLTPLKNTRQLRQAS